MDSPVHKTQESHDLVVEYATLRAWVREHCGIALPEKEIDVTLEANAGKLAIAWQEAWRERPIAVAAKPEPPR